MTRTDMNEFLAQLSQCPPTYEWAPQDRDDVPHMDNAGMFRPQERIAVSVHPTGDSPPLPDGLASPPPHRHEFVEIAYLWSGSCTMEVEGTTLSLAPGDFIMLDTHSSHCPNVPSGAILINLAVMTSYFNDSFFQNFDWDDVLAKFFASMLYSQKSERRYIVFRPQNDPRIRQLIAMIVTEYFSQEICSVRITENLMTVLFSTMVRLQRQQNAQLSAQQSLEDGIVAEILGYMRENILTVTRDSLAEHFGYSYSYVSSVLQSATGMTFSKLKNTLRLQQAERLLRHSDKPVVVIARLSGFSNVTSFYEMFRRQYGMSPQDYRDTRTR